MPPSPLAGQADTRLARLITAGAGGPLRAIDGATLLGERAMLAGLRQPGQISAGGACRLLATRDGMIALSLPRDADRDLLPALFASATIDPADDRAIAAAVRLASSTALVERGRMLGLAIADIDEDEPSPPPVTLLAAGGRAATPRRARPRVLDLSALWAGPLAAHLLWVAKADVAKIEAPHRPDGARGGDPGFYALLNQGKAAVALDLAIAADRTVLLALIRAADIVIESARPRVLQQFGVDAAALVAAQPGLVWISITAYGAMEPAANWIGFGDDVGVAAGLSRACREAIGRAAFLGDAIADPLTGIEAAATAWEAWRSGRGGRYGVTMRGVAAACLAEAEPRLLADALRAAARAAGEPFPAVPRRPIGAAAALGADSNALIQRWTSC